ncbi:MAG: DMT family transporter [Terrimicrobiaceae bacterium]|jgi:multidrug transporter EmrE-like cation transporter
MNAGMSWIYLGIAIIAEVIGTSTLKSTDGFTRLGSSLVAVMGYILSFYFLSLALRTIPVGIAYAVWCGLGIVLVTMAAWVFYGQKLNAAGFIGMGLIITGVWVLSVFKNTHEG